MISGTDYSKPVVEMICDHGYLVSDTFEGLIFGLRDFVRDNYGNFGYASFYTVQEAEQMKNMDDDDFYIEPRQALGYRWYQWFMKNQEPKFDTMDHSGCTKV